MDKQIALVSGGTRGIGKAIVQLLLEKNYRVAFSYKKQDDLANQILQENRALGRELLSYKADIANTSDIKHMIQDIEIKWGYIDVLVNNAGIIKDHSLAFMTDEEWNDVMQVNLYGMFYLSRACVYSMIKRKKGRIINIGSTSGINGIKGQVNYSASKAGMIGFTKALAKEVAQYGVSVNCMALGGIETDMTASLNEKRKKSMISEVPIGRFGTTHEVAQVTAFLADFELCPNYLTGAIISLDGGMGL